MRLESVSRWEAGSVACHHILASRLLPSMPDLFLAATSPPPVFIMFPDLHKYLYMQSGKHRCGGWAWARAVGPAPFCTIETERAPAQAPRALLRLPKTDAVSDECHKISSHQGQSPRCGL